MGASGWPLPDVGHQQHTAHTRGISSKLVLVGGKQDIRRKFFTLRVVKCWNRLLREVVKAPFLETFEVKLDEALGNLMSLLTAEGLDRMTFKGHFKPDALYDEFYDDSMMIL